MSSGSLSISFLPCELDQCRPVPFCFCSLWTPCGDVRLCLVYTAHSPELHGYLQAATQVLCSPPTLQVCHHLKTIIFLWLGIFGCYPTACGHFGIYRSSPQRNSYLECWKYFQKAKMYHSAECGFRIASYGSNWFIFLQWSDCRNSWRLGQREEADCLLPPGTLK